MMSQAGLTMGVLAIVAAAGPPAGTLIDRVVAVIDKQVITASELMVEARIALAYKEGEQAATADLDDPILRAFLDYLVNQTLISMQARRLGAAEVSQADVDREEHQFGQRFRSVAAFRAFLRRFDISEETLRNVLQRKLRNDKYLADRMRLRVSEGELDPESPSYQIALARWIAELRQTAEIRLLGPTGELELQPREGEVGAAASAPVVVPPHAELAPVGGRP